MAKLMFCATYGFDNPNRATLVMYLAEGAVEAGHEVTLALMNDTVTLLKRDTAAELQAHGFPPFLEMLENFSGEILVCTGCANKRGIFEEDVDINFTDPDAVRLTFVGRVDIANKMATVDNVASF